MTEWRERKVDAGKHRRNGCLLGLALSALSCVVVAVLLYVAAWVVPGVR